MPLAFAVAPRAAVPRSVLVAPALEALRDVASDDWTFPRAEPSWLNLCFFTSFITAASVHQAVVRGRPTFAISPALVLVTSVLHWFDPQVDSWRRTLDISVVRIGMFWQVGLALALCRPMGAILLLASYTSGGLCYGLGRILNVRGHDALAAWVHVGVHVFANVGNILLLAHVRDRESQQLMLAERAKLRVRAKRHGVT